MNENQGEAEELKRQLRIERLLHESEIAKAEHKAYVEKKNSTEKLAWVSVLLFCAVAIILGLTGIVD